MKAHYLLILLSLTGVVSPLFAEDLQPEIPTVLGSASVNTAASAVVGQSVDVTIVFTAESTIAAGGAFQLAHHWMHPVDYQPDAPDQPNHIYIETSVPDVRFEFSYEERRGSHGGLESIIHLPVFTLKEGQIQFGDEVRIVVSNFTLPIVSLQEFVLPLYLRTVETQSWHQIKTSPFPVMAARLAGINISASSIVVPFEEISVLVRLEDQYGNLVQDRSMSLDLLVNGTFRQRLSISSAIQEIPGIRFDIEGIYQLEIRSGGGGLRATSNPVLVRSGQRDEVIWADIGVPSSFSDGIRSPDEVLAAAAGLYDLVVPMEHDDGVRLEMISSNERGIEILEPERPTDLRFLSSESAKLVQVAAGSSGYLWFGEKVAAMGIPAGFVGTNHSHQYPRKNRPVYTGIRISNKQPWMQALARNQTYVSVGSKITLMEKHAARLPMEGERKLGIEVIARHPVISVRLMKNGNEIDRLVTSGDDNRAVTLSLYSTSEPFSPIRSKPRNAREWVGYIATRDTDIGVADNADQYRQAGWWQLHQDANKKRIDFLTRTHGMPAQVTVMLDTPTQDTVLEVGLAPGFEDAAWLPQDRLPTATPGQRFMIPVAELQRTAVREYEVSGYRDRITAQYAVVPQANHVSYAYTDKDEPRIGDYYYFLVDLADGSWAASSPVFVGEF